jgi:hypothetical protein
LKTSKFDIDELEKELRNYLKRYDPMYKPEIIRVNISSTFICRSKCLECGEGPSEYFHIRSPSLSKDVSLDIKFSAHFRDFIKRMSNDWYLEGDPKYFRDIKEFSFILEDKQYRPTLHRTRGSDIKLRDNVIEIAICDCGATTWAFNQKSTKKRPEITNRKGKYFYPKKFEY